MLNYGEHDSTNRVISRRVFFTGSTALQKGYGVCYDADRGTATEADEKRARYVELPSTTNSLHFAGVVARDYDAVSGGQMIEIYEPGSVCEVAVGADTVVDSTILTCSAGAGDKGRFDFEGFPGRGTIKALQTKTVQLESDLDGSSGVLDSAGTTLTDASATFVTNGVAAGDKVVIIGGEDDDTNAATPGVYTVSSVTSETALVLTSAASDGGTMQVSYYIYSGNPRVLAYLMDGEESGLQEVVSAPSPGHATADTFTVMQTGVTRFAAGWTIATNNARAPLSNGYLGQKKAFICLGTVGTSDIEIELDSDGIQTKVLDEVTTGQSPQGAPLALHAITFDAASEAAYLEFHGVWREMYHTGCAIATS